jgi:hypothetical protein
MPWNPGKNLKRRGSCGKRGVKQHAPFAARFSFGVVEEKAMADPDSEDHLSVLGRWARVIVTLLYVVILLPSLGAFGLGWSSGLRGEHKGDEAIRDVLVAIALLALGLVFAVVFLGSLLWYIAVRVNKLDGQRLLTTDQTKPTA